MSGASPSFGHRVAYFSGGLVAVTLGLSLFGLAFDLIDMMRPWHLPFYIAVPCVGAFCVVVTPFILGGMALIGAAFQLSIAVPDHPTPTQEQARE